MLVMVNNTSTTKRNKTTPKGGKPMPNGTPSEKRINSKPSIGIRMTQIVAKPVTNINLDLLPYWGGVALAILIGLDFFIAVLPSQNA